ncbi:MAG TPA: MmcQ/YjbR family DNA-binding protein [Egibacteraceae bacterium]|nr:MmcQ/YjbR family DNA-binding protein [Egibacteraceae bacterium]
MQPTARDQLPYSDADVAAATDRLRGICGGMPEVTERVSHGAVTFFVRGKRTLCYLTDDHHGDGRLALVCPAPPGVQEEMVEAEPERFFRPPYVGHRGWIGLRLDVAPDWQEVAGIVADAYRCVAPVTLVRRLDAGEGGQG